MCDIEFIEESGEINPDGLEEVVRKRLQPFEFRKLTKEEKEQRLKYLKLDPVPYIYPNDKWESKDIDLFYDPRTEAYDVTITHNPEPVHSYKRRAELSKTHTEILTEELINKLKEIKANYAIHGK